MTRRPRFPLIARLGWIEQELNAAAALLPAMIGDLKELRSQGSERDMRLAMVAGVSTAALLAIGIAPPTLEAFLAAVAPGGDLDEAEALAAGILHQVMLLTAPEPDGERH